MADLERLGTAKGAQMSLTELAVKRPTALVAIFALLIGLGVMGYFNLGADLFPSTNTPFVGVHSVYPGAGSKEIEKDLVKPMEDAVSSLPGIKTIRSTSGEGYGLVGPRSSRWTPTPTRP